MKKKYQRKKKDLKDANKSGTSTEVISKAQKSLRPYEFMKWLDDFIQTRQGRSNLPAKVQGNEEDLFYDEENTMVELSPATEE